MRSMFCRCLIANGMWVTKNKLTMCLMQMSGQTEEGKLIKLKILIVYALQNYAWNILYI